MLAKSLWSVPVKVAATHEFYPSAGGNNIPFS
jgi:hypothetical protein